MSPPATVSANRDAVGVDAPIVGATLFPVLAEDPVQSGGHLFRGGASACLLPASAARSRVGRGCLRPARNPARGDGDVSARGDLRKVKTRRRAVRATTAVAPYVDAQLAGGCRSREVGRLIHNVLEPARPHGVARWVFATAGDVRHLSPHTHLGKRVSGLLSHRRVRISGHHRPHTAPGPSAARGALSGGAGLRRRLPQESGPDQRQG